jgi:hypothetical protein
MAFAEARATLKGLAAETHGKEAGPSTSSTVSAKQTFVPMRWSREMKGSNVTLSEGDMTATHATSRWDAVVGDTWLEGGVYKIELATEDVDNLSLFVGVVERGYWAEVQAAEEGEDVLPRDSKYSICMHGDGRTFIRGIEKDWGMMRVATGDPIEITIDFTRGVVIFRLTRTVRGKERETAAEIPGLRGAVTILACFGGRDQSLTIARCERIKDTLHGVKKERDTFGDALDGVEHVAPIAFSESKKGLSYEEQIRDMAATMETSM